MLLRKFNKRLFSLVYELALQMGKGKKQSKIVRPADQPAKEEKRPGRQKVKEIEKTPGCVTPLSCEFGNFTLLLCLERKVRS